MATHSDSSRPQTIKAQVESKIQALLKEFSDGTLNREQFNMLYERYSGQLSLAQQAIASGSEAMSSAAQGGQSTIAIKQEHMGKAIGLVIYQNRTGVSIETLGDFDVSAYVISPVLNDFSRMMESQRLIEHRTIQLDDRRWLLFAGGRFTTVVTLFRNEPSPLQVREIVRLHNDFEIANAPLLEKGHLDTKKMAYPFVVFVQQKLKNV